MKPAHLGTGTGGAPSLGASGLGRPARAPGEAQARPRRAGARGGQQVGPGGRTPPRPPSLLVRSRPAPAPLQSRSAIGGGSCRSEGAGPPCSAALPAATAVLLAARAGRTAKATGSWRWEAVRPRTRAVAKFPRRAYSGAQLPDTRDRSKKGSEVFNLETKSTSFPLSSSLPEWPAAGAQTWVQQLHGQQTRLWGTSGPRCSGAKRPLA